MDQHLLASRSACHIASKSDERISRSLSEIKYLPNILGLVKVGIHDKPR